MTTYADALTQTPLTSPQQIDTAVTTAYARKASWRRTSASERSSRLRSAAASIRADADRLGELLTATTGRLLREATASAIVAADLLDESAAAVLTGDGRTLPGSADAVDVVRVEPRGLVAVITPWNDPYPAAAGLLAAALATGNTVVHKPSERSMAPGLALAGHLIAALPDGVLTLLEGDGQVGAALAADPRVDVVAHIGSTAAGLAIAETVGRRGGRVVRENGGKDACLVDAGVDPAWAARQIAVGAFANGGQLCVSVERVYAHRSGANAMLDELVHAAEELRAGDPGDPATTLTRIIDERQLAVIEEHVADALAQGARVLTGGRRVEPGSLFFAPTVLVDCTPAMRVMTEETFGPVVAVALVDDIDEAVAAANASAYGLAATILTPDLARALHAADVLDVGTVKVNAVFGGAPGGSADPRRGSGSGTGFGPDLLREFTAVKAIHLEAPPRPPRHG